MSLRTESATVSAVDHAQESQNQPTRSEAASAVGYAQEGRHSSQRRKQTLELPGDPPRRHSVGFDGYDDDWDPIRNALGKAISSRAFDVSVSLVILTNMVVLVVETDQRAAYGIVPAWVDTANVFFIGIYALEMALRIWIYRSYFFQDYSSMADLAIVVIDAIIWLFIWLVGEHHDMPSIVVLRTFRLLRLTHSRKTLELFPELNVMVRGLAGAFKAIFWGMILLFIVLLIWGILAVQIIHPLNRQVTETGIYGGNTPCERCPRAFNSVAESILTFTQHIVAGDSWGAVSIPIIEKFPLTFVFFFMVLVSVGMAILNLILAVVIDCAGEARKDTDHQRSIYKYQCFQAASQHLYKFCKDMDTDKSGALTLEELANGFESNTAFQDALAVLDVKRDDLYTVFSILDADKSGDVNYNEFVEQLYKMKTDDSHTLLVFIKYHMSEVRRKVSEELRLLRAMISEKDLLHASSSHFKTGEENACVRSEYPTWSELEDAELLATELQRADFRRLQQNCHQTVALLEQVAKDVQMNHCILNSLSPVLFHLPAAHLGYDEQPIVSTTSIQRKQTIVPLLEVVPSAGSDRNEASVGADCRNSRPEASSWQVAI